MGASQSWLMSAADERSSQPHSSMYPVVVPPISPMPSSGFPMTAPAWLNAREVTQMSTSGPHRQLLQSPVDPSGHLVERLNAARLDARHLATGPSDSFSSAASAPHAGESSTHLGDSLTHASESSTYGHASVCRLSFMMLPCRLLAHHIQAMIAQLCKLTAVSAHGRLEVGGSRNVPHLCSHASSSENQHVVCHATEHAWCQLG